MDRPRTIFISVLIPAFNEANRIRKTIESVDQSMRALSLTDYEIIVCDNNSSDKTGAIAEEAGAKLVFESHNQIARARNRAAEAASGKWLIFLDADSQLSSDLLEETFERMKNGSIGAWGALLRFDRTDLPRHVKFGLGCWNFASRTMKWPAGSYLFCLGKAWEEVGGFPEEWYAAEEIAFARLLKKWCRKKRLRFAIITENRLTTSSRKVEKHSIWQTISLLLSLTVPGALKSRSRCHYWYRRKG